MISLSSIYNKYTLEEKFVMAKSPDGGYYFVLESASLCATA